MLRFTNWYSSRPPASESMKSASTLRAQQLATPPSSHVALTSWPFPNSLCVKPLRADLLCLQDVDFFTNGGARS